ncbi:MAG: lipopolysaccharide heptosyltransferase II [Deltaproteobacteria bacterium]|nr:lipopolysaccharide heptosyltransferase II [Deltaproteobacteria bacterium]
MLKPPTQFIRGLNWLGDAIISLPALDTLIDREYSVLSARGAGFNLYQALFQDKCALLEDRRGFKERLSYIKRLRSLPLEKAVLLQNAFGAALNAFFSGIPQRLGYLRDGRGPLLTKKLLLNDELLSAHEVFYHLNLVSEKDANNCFHFPKLGELSPQLDGKVPHEFQKLRDNCPFLLGVAPGASFGSAKKAPLELFAGAAKLLLETFSGGLVILGSQAEEVDAQALMKLLPTGPKVLNLTGKTSLPKLINIVKSLNLMITNDSGLMHLGTASGIKLLALFGPTNPITTGPLSLGSLVIRGKDVPCAPCLKRTCPLERRICFDSISVEDIYHKALELLKPQAPAPDKSPALLLLDESILNDSLSNDTLSKDSLINDSINKVDMPLRALGLPKGADPTSLASYEELSEREKVDLSRSVFVGTSLATLQKAASFGGNALLSLESGIPTELSKKPPLPSFLPKVTAPTHAFAIAAAGAMLKEIKLAEVK